jgi:hypothetical protein
LFAWVESPIYIVSIDNKWCKQLTLRIFLLRVDSYWFYVKNSKNYLPPSSGITFLELFVFYALINYEESPLGTPECISHINKITTTVETSLWIVLLIDNEGIFISEIFDNLNFFNSGIPRSLKKGIYKHIIQGKIISLY